MYEGRALPASKLACCCLPLSLTVPPSPSVILPCLRRSSSLLSLVDDRRVYFVHSYHATPTPQVGGRVGTAGRRGEVAGRAAQAASCGQFLALLLLQILPLLLLPGANNVPPALLLAQQRQHAQIDHSASNQRV